MKRDLRQELREAILEHLRTLTDLSADSIREAAAEACVAFERYRRVRIDPDLLGEITDAIVDAAHGLGPIQALMDDPRVTEIMINGPARIFVERDGVKSRESCRFASEAELRRIVERMIAPTGRRLDERLPYADFALENGARVHAILPPLSVGGATVTIRKFLDWLRSIDDLGRMGTLDWRMARFLEACIRGRINILFSGPTGSGKTTTLEVLSAAIDPKDRIVIIEDAPELTLRQEHVVRLLTRPPGIEGSGEVTIRTLVRNCFRMRPTRIILGEIRGEEAIDYLQAQTSGHRGCLAVIHASSPRDAVMRLETLALYAGLNLPAWAIRQQIASGLQLIVQHEQLNDGRRVITNVTEVTGMADGDVGLHDIFRFEIDPHATASRPDGAPVGRFVATGAPAFLPLLAQRGVRLDGTVFS